MSKIYYTIYETVNKINGKKYIGKHQTTKIDDSYLGSGSLLKKAILKYGKDQFHKNVLFTFDTEEEMNTKERELITSEIVLSNMFYNLGPGGEGGPMFKGKKHTDDTKSKLQVISSNPSPETKEKRSVFAKNRKHTDETKRKIQKAMKLRRHTEDSKKKISNSLKGKKHSEETKQKIREGRLKILGKL